MHEKIVEILLRYGANVNQHLEVAEDGVIKKHSTALHLAVHKKSVATVHSLLASDKIILDEKDKLGKTALVYAFESKAEEIAKLLINKGANFNENIGDLIVQYDCNWPWLSKYFGAKDTLIKDSDSATVQDVKLTNTNILNNAEKQSPDEFEVSVSGE